MKRALLALLLAAPIARGDLLLNEIRIDQPGGDNDEYFEIFSTDPANDSLADVVLLVIGDGTGGSGVIENVTDLTGQSLGSPWFVVAESTFTLGTADFTTLLNFENSDNLTFALVKGFTGANGDDLDLDDDGVLDLMPWNTLLDAVALLETTETPPTTTEWAYPSLGAAVGPDGDLVPGHVYRRPDGGAWRIGPFDLADSEDTPGAPNLIPEPSTAALLLLGMGALFLRRRA